MKNKKVVVIGGGTGSSTVLSGLKNYKNLDITAIVSTFDSGGSTRKLVDEHGVLPMGDIRRCLVALSEYPALRDLFLYRFSKKTSLNGHSFGNLTLTALEEIEKEKMQKIKGRKVLTSEEENECKVLAIKSASIILRIRGTVLPISVEKAELCAHLEDGTLIRGETNIDVPKHDGNLAIAKVFLHPESKINDEAFQAIQSADLIVLGPGDLFTSTIPNLLVKDVDRAISQSRAEIAYVVNVMSKWGETNGYSASRFIEVILRYLNKDKLDYVICYDGKLEDSLLQKYRFQKSDFVKIDKAVYEQAKQVIVRQDIVSQAGGYIRHDSAALGRVLVGLLS